MGIAVQGGAVTFDDINGVSPKITGTRDSREARREGHFAWASGDALILECVPAAPSLPGLYPGSSILYVKSIVIEPVAEEGNFTCGNVAVYSRGKAVIEYGKLDYDSATLVTRKWGFSGEFMTLPANSMRWDNGDAVENEEISAAKNIRMTEHSMTRHRATTIPWTTIRNCIGKVNSAILNDAIFDNVAAESLLYLGASIDWTLSTNGSVEWTLEHRFQERLVENNGVRYGWNHFWRPDKKRWEKLKDDNGRYTYESTNDMDDLF